MQRRCRLAFLLLALVLAFILAGCDQKSEDIALAPPQTITDGDAYIRAVDAWYVVGHDQRGAMGHTLASFAEQADAEAFREAHGGELVTYTEIDLDLLGRLGRGELGDHQSQQDRRDSHASPAGGLIRRQPRPRIC